MTMYTPPSRPGDAARKRKDRIVRTTIVTFGTIFVIAMSYGSGMRAQSKRLASEYERVKIAESDLRLTQFDLQASNALVQQLEARRQIALALDALAAHNQIGARAHLSEARTRLMTADTVQAATAINAPQLPGKIAQLVAQPQPSSASVVAILREMDEKFPRAVPKPDKMFTVTVKPPNANDVPAVPGTDVTTPDVEPNNPKPTPK